MLEGPSPGFRTLRAQDSVASDVPSAFGTLDVPSVEETMVSRCDWVQDIGYIHSHVYVIICIYTMLL